MTACLYFVPCQIYFVLFKFSFRNSMKILLLLYWSYLFMLVVVNWLTVEALVGKLLKTICMWNDTSVLNPLYTNQIWAALEGTWDCSMEGHSWMDSHLPYPSKFVKKGPKKMVKSRYYGQTIIICCQIPHLLRAYPASTVIGVLLSTGLVPPSQPITI